MSEIQDSERRQEPARQARKGFFQRLFSWRVMVRCLFVVACLATLIGLFYAEEDWRGKRAWETCRRELEAKGAVLDWDAYIPGPVPDDQNIFKAPKMTEWFVKASMAEFGPGPTARPSKDKESFSVSESWRTKKSPTLLAVVDVVLPGKPLPAEKADAVWRYDDPASHEQAARLFDDLAGPRMNSAQGGVITTRPLDRTNPLYLVLRSDIKPTMPGLSAFLSPGAGSENKGTASGLSYFQVKPRGNNAFQVSVLSATYSATDYLARSQPAVADLNLLREAVKRPYARMDRDYQRPFERPIAGFVRMRNVAQMLSQRAQCYLLLGQSEAAWHELALVRDMCRMTEARPASNCPTLVETMIDVAITGLYTSIIHDGLRLHGWQEPELAAIQKQLSGINLLPLLRVSFTAERAASIRMIETTPPAELKKTLNLPEKSPGLFGRLGNPTYVLITFAPRGWRYQNMCARAIGSRLTIESFDVPNNQILPRQVDGIMGEIRTTFSSFSPYTWLASITMPNFAKAIRTTAHNQTLANEAYIACGLERYGLAKGQYPESLEALVPQFAEKLPHDIIGGGPLHYHRTVEGRFVLYSVGWDGKDDGGVAGKAIEVGDWVWQ